MPIVYDPSTDRGKVRLLISDVGGQNGATFIFTDAEIDTFLALRADVGLAAALALRTLAANEAQISKRITLLDLQTDGPAVARALLALADTLEAGAEGDVDFEVAEMGTTPSARAELRGFGDRF